MLTSCLSKFIVLALKRMLMKVSISSASTSHWLISPTEMTWLKQGLRLKKPRLCFLLSVIHNGGRLYLVLLFISHRFSGLYLRTFIAWKLKIDVNLCTQLPGRPENGNLPESITNSQPNARFFIIMDLLVLN